MPIPWACSREMDIYLFNEGTHYEVYKNWARIS